MANVGLIGLPVPPALSRLPTAIVHPVLGPGHFLNFQER